jgi:hypothetical protein
MYAWPFSLVYGRRFSPLTAQDDELVVVERRRVDLCLQVERQRQVAALQVQMETALNYEQWFQAAVKLDALEQRGALTCGMQQASCR